MNSITPPVPFIQELHNALLNLYDPVVLGKSRLVRLFSLQDRPNPGLSLQDTIAAAVQSLQPRGDVPLQSNAWRFYNVLTFRYLEQSSQSLVADTLGLSVRQLRRDEKAAEQWLAAYLWKTFGFPDQYQELMGDPFFKDTNPDHLREVEQISPSREQELEWLRESFPDESISIDELVITSISRVKPLLEHAGIEVLCKLDEASSEVWGQVAAMRQALMNVLLAAMHASGGQTIHLATEIGDEKTAIKILVGEKQGVIDRNQLEEYLSMAVNLVKVFDGELELHDNLNFVVILRFPVVEKKHVLIIDDNADTLQLLQRYLSGTQYQFMGVRDPEKALDIAIQNRPDVIVLDVMMPGMDDWELLGRIRNHPETEQVPVVICTILPQETLAYALGASGFIRKPINRTAFLAALEQQISRDLKKLY